MLPYPKTMPGSPAEDAWWREAEHLRNGGKEHVDPPSPLYRPTKTPDNG